MVNTCAFSGDSRYIVSGDWNGNVLVWDASIHSKEEIFSAFHMDAIRTCAISC